MIEINDSKIKETIKFLGITEEEYTEFFEKGVSTAQYEFEYTRSCIEIQKNIKKLATQLSIITPQMIFNNDLPDIDTTINSIISLKNKIAIIRNLRKL